MAKSSPQMLLVILLLNAAAHGANSFSDAEFVRLHQELRPAPDELWRTIPWQTSVLDAQKIAGAERKPIFIWAMDGHPLGCT